MPTDQRVDFYRHNLGDEEKACVLAALDETMLTTGRAVTEAEQALAEYLDVLNVVCLDSGTAALHLALIANGIGPGDQVVVPAMTAFTLIRVPTPFLFEPVPSHAMIIQWFSLPVLRYRELSWFKLAVNKSICPSLSKSVQAAACEFDSSITISPSVIFVKVPPPLFLYRKF